MGARVMNLTGITSILLGLTAGVLFAIVLSKYQAIGRTDQVHLQTKRPTPAEEVSSQNVYFILPEWMGKVFENTSADSEVAHLVNRESKQGLFDPRLNSTFLYDREKILCFVIVDRHRIGTYGKSAKATWTKHCNKVIFLSSVSNRDIGVIDISLPVGKAKSWARTKLALQFVYNRFKESEFRWFVKASHDTLLVVENLRYLLFMHRANIPNYIGHVFSGPKSGGSAFALSKEGLALIEPTLKDYKPKFGGSADDLELEECLKLAGAVPGRQGKDADGVERFQMIIPDHKLPLNTEAFAALYWRYIRQPEKEVGKMGIPAPETFRS